MTTTTLPYLLLTISKLGGTYDSWSSNRRATNLWRKSVLQSEFREINLNKPNFKLSNLQNVSFFSEKTITSSDQLRPIAETIRNNRSLQQITPKNETPIRAINPTDRPWVRLWISK